MRNILGDSTPAIVVAMLHIWNVLLRPLDASLLRWRFGLELMRIMHSGSAARFDTDVLARLAY